MGSNIVHKSYILLSSFMILIWDFVNNITIALWNQEMAKIKAVHLENLYNFIVENFFNLNWFTKCILNFSLSSVFFSPAVGKYVVCRVKKNTQQKRCLPSVGGKQTRQRPCLPSVLPNVFILESARQNALGKEEDTQQTLIFQVVQVQWLKRNWNTNKRRYEFINIDSKNLQGWTTIHMEYWNFKTKHEIWGQRWTKFWIESVPSHQLYLGLKKFHLRVLKMPIVLWNLSTNLRDHGIKSLHHLDALGCSCIGQDDEQMAATIHTKGRMGGSRYL